MNPGELGAWFKLPKGYGTSTKIIYCPLCHGRENGKRPQCHCWDEQRAGYYKKKSETEGKS